MTVFSMFACLMFCSKLLLEWAPNIHLLAMLTVAITAVYRAKALIPIYVFVLLTGLYGGFSPWWVPYLYIWTLLWGVAMLLPHRRMKPAVSVPVYMVICGLHGILYGVLYAPAQALLFGLDFKGTLAWIAAGAAFDVMHCIGNLAAGTLTLPLIRLLTRLERHRVS